MGVAQTDEEAKSTNVVMMFYMVSSVIFKNHKRQAWQLTVLNETSVLKIYE